MDDLSRRLERARNAVAGSWDEDATVDARRRLDRRVRRDAALRVAAVVAVAVGGTALLLWATSNRRSERDRHAVEPPAPTAPPDQRDAPVEPERAAPSPRPPVVTHSHGESRMRVLHDSPDRVELSVDDGRVTFEVDPTAGKEVRVTAGELVIQVHARSFAVERSERGVGVWVYEGWVSVDAGDSRVLRAGDDVWIPTREPVPPQQTPSNPGRDDWRDLARDGQFEEAFEALGDAEIADDVADLMLAADAARISGHPREAIPHLERVVRDHSGDPRAPLAAFTLGRVFLYQLGEPRHAAEAFAVARDLGLDRSLAEDALAREVEAWSRAGEEDRASALASEYARTYPEGRHARSVRKYGGLP